LVLVNVTSLHILLRNLIDNAIRYTPHDGFVKIYVERKLDNISIRVVDSGPGIPANLRSRVFERFYRVIGTKAQGSGLGLAIVQQIVKLHKGSVILGTPTSGVGLEVEVLLPRVNS
jgi:two-component system sensor histidine kinase QseC